VFDRQYVKRLDGPNVKKGRTSAIWPSSSARTSGLQEGTRSQPPRDDLVRQHEIFLTETPAHQSIEAFEKALEEDGPVHSLVHDLYYAALMEGVPYANGAPNLSVDVPAMMDLAHKNQVPITGKDFKTGQTLIKTVIAPA